MALERGYTMIQITYEGRELLRALSYIRHKPMYEVLVEAIQEAITKVENENAVLATAKQ